MGVIGHSDQDVWVVARWAFQGYLDHVLAEVRGDPVLTHAVEQAIALDGLHLDRKDLVTVERLRPVLVRVADEVIGGARRVDVEGRMLDNRSQVQFRRAVAELRAMFARWWPADVPKPG